MALQNGSSDPVFVDTGGWIALLSVGDDYAARAAKVLRALRVRRITLLTTTAVLFEVLDGAASRDRRTSWGLRAFVKQAEVEVIIVTLELMDKAWQLFDARPDKEWGLTDCVSFIVMQERRLTDAFAHDHHFQQAGFRALLREETT